MYSRDDLIGFQRNHDTLVAIDSDGCVFDSMEVKQKICFHPLIVRHWALEAVEAQLRETAEFVNLYSAHRGQNRFVALLKTFELLARRGDMDGVKLPATASLRDFVESGDQLTNGALANRTGRTRDAELERLLQWSLEVNQAVEETVTDVPPFEGARRALETMAGTSDLIVCSQTPEEALIREWDDQGIRSFVAVIAGQELGTKAEHLSMVIADTYEVERVVMIGDAPGDLRAAEANGVYFYPIHPGEEEGSWNRWGKEAYPRFLRGTFGGEYQASLIADFEKRLPEEPGWLQLELG
jgi:phosphoglycolate phosphatase-like HAD superfamily hydrolase